MKIIKRGQIAIISCAFMIMIAGYINYKYDPLREKDLGQTVYVNGKDSFTYGDVDIYSKTNENDKTAQTKNTDDSISVFKYDRDNMFSELNENYSKIINNQSTSKDTINEYQKKLNALIEEKNLITMVENVIKSKGIEDIVIIPTSNDNINVVVKSKEELKPEQMAQIQQILVDQLGAKANKISITCKKNN